MKAPGWIKIYRSMLDWEWYEDANVFRVFMHLLLSANFEDKEWKGMTIKRGQLIIGTEKLGEKLRLKRQPTRTALDKLKSTGEITTKSTNKNILVTIVKYELYQSFSDEDDQQNNHQDNHQITSQQPTTQPSSNHQLTTTKEVKKLRREEGKKVVKIFTPPKEEQIHELFLSVGMIEDSGSEARKFIDYYAQQSWKLSNGNKMTDWKAAARNWLRNQQKWNKEK